MKTRRGFLGQMMGGVATVAIAPSVPVAELIAPAAKQVATDALTAKLYSKRLAIEAITGTYAQQFAPMNKNA